MANITPGWSLSKTSEALVRNLRVNSMVERGRDPEMNAGYSNLHLGHMELSGQLSKNGDSIRGPSKTAQTPRKATEEEDDEEEEIYNGRRLQVRGKELPFLFLMECLTFVLGMSLLIASLIVHSLKNFEILGVLVWKWCTIAVILLCGRLFTGWVIQILAYLIENNFLFKNNFLHFVYGLKKSIQVCLWMPLFLLTWFLLFDSGFAQSSPKTRKVLNYVWRTIAVALVVVVMEELKTFLLKKLACSFRANLYFDRIQESIFHQYILQRLSEPPVLREDAGKLKVKNAEARKKGSVENGVIDVEKLQKIEQKNVSVWTMNGLVNAITSGLSTTTKISEEADQTSDKEDEEDNFIRETDGSVDLMDTITSEFQASTAAQNIFRKCARPCSKYIEEEDLLRFLTKEEVDSLFGLFEGSTETGKITKKAFRDWVVKFYFERKSLARVLNGTKTNMKYLNKIGAGFVLCAIPVIWLLIMGFPAAQVAIFISSLLIPMTFVFGSSFKTLLEAVIFVFVTHPFAVGDRCVVDGEQVVVESMDILTTIFLTSYNEKLYYPNAVLAMKPIKNLYRSPNMGDSVEFCIDASTPMEAIADLKSKIAKYLEYKPRYWHPKHTVEAKEIENVNKLKMVLYVQHTMNHQNMGEKITRRSELVLEMKKIFENLGIKYHMLPQHVHVVSYVSVAQPHFDAKVGIKH